MARLFWILPAVLFAFWELGEGLECYHCYSKGKYSGKDSNFIPCNEKNLTASNTWICPNANARCITQMVEFQTTGDQQTWRTCSNGLSDPCDPNMLPPGVKMIKCLHCGTDRCNIQQVEEPQNTFTFNINANVNLYIRQ